MGSKPFRLGRQHDIFDACPDIEKKSLGHVSIHKDQYQDRRPPKLKRSFLNKRFWLNSLIFQCLKQVFKKESASF